MMQVKEITVTIQLQLSLPLCTFYRILQHERGVMCVLVDFREKIEEVKRIADEGWDRL